MKKVKETIGMMCFKTIAIGLILNFAVTNPVYVHAETVNNKIIISNDVEDKAKLEFCNDMHKETAEDRIKETITIQKETQEIKMKPIAAKAEFKEVKKVEKKEEVSSNEVCYPDVDETFLLAAIIHCEAGSESYEGKIAVGNVVLNRVHSPSFPNTIKEVIFQNKQFSPVRNGSLKNVLNQGTVDDECMRAAQDSLNNVKVVQDCLYFKSTKLKGDGLVIGNHLFY